MTEETIDVAAPRAHWFERWINSSFENCACSCTQPHDPEPLMGPHDGWRHPIGMSLITCSVMVGLAPEGWSTMVKDAWREGRRVWSTVQAACFTLLWLLSGVGLLSFSVLFALTTPLRWISSKLRSGS